MRPELKPTGLAAGLFVREQLRSPLTLVLLLVLPVVFVTASAAVLGPFAKALGGSASGHAATALGAGWAAAFLASDMASYISGASLEVHGGGEPPHYLATTTASAIK